jgi:hypothetical protein
MGSFGSGFLQGINDVVKKKSDQHAQDEQQKKHDLAAVHMAALQSGTLTPEQQEASWKAYMDLYGKSKGLKEALPKFKALATHAMQQGQDQSGGQADGSQQAAPAPGGIPPPPVTATTAPTPPASAPVATPASPTSALASPPPPAAGDGKTAGGPNGTMQQMQGSGVPTVGPILPLMPRSQDAGVSQDASANPGAAAQGQLSQSRQRGTSPGPTGENGLPQVQQPQGGNAPSGLQPATSGVLDVQAVPSSTPQGGNSGLSVSRGTIPPPPSARVQALDTTDPAAIMAAQMGGQAPAAKQAVPSPPPGPPPVGVQPWELGAAFPSRDAQEKHAQELEQRKLDAAWANEQRKLDLTHKNKMEEVLATAQAKATNPSGRPVAARPLALTNAKDIQQETGKPYLDQDGDEIDLSKLPDNVALQPFFQGTKEWVVPYSPDEKLVTVNGHVIAANPMMLSAIAKGGGTDLGLKNPGMTSATLGGVTTLDDNPNSPTYGKWIQLGGERVQRPNDPGRPGGIAAPPVTPGGATSPTAKRPASSTANTRPTTPASGSTAAPPTPKPVQTAGGGVRRTLPGIPAAQLAQQQKRDTAINVAGQGLQLFAQKKPDGFSNLDVFKDPAAVSRIANYLTLNNAAMEGDFENAQKGGTDGILSFYARLPQEFANQKNKAIQDAYSGLTKHDQKFVSDFYTLAGQWGGIRSATGAPASQWSFRNIMQEMPNPQSMNSYDEARTKVGNMFAELQGISEPNTTIRKYSIDDILPSQKATGKAVPPPPADGAKKFSVTAPDGSVHNFKDQAGVDKFNKLLADAQKGAK